jgi:hypothetical protein
MIRVNIGVAFSLKPNFLRKLSIPLGRIETSFFLRRQTLGHVFGVIRRTQDMATKGMQAGAANMAELHEPLGEFRVAQRTKLKFGRMLSCEVKR